MASISRSLSAGLQHELDRITALDGIERVPGVVLSVFDGEDLHQWVSGRAGGPRDSELTAGTLFRIASITKTYTATLVMQLVDEGTVDLDRPVAAQLPEFRLAGEAETAAITPRQLLAHTSGVPGDWGFDGGRGDDAVTRYVASLAELRTAFPPGLMHSYSNAGYVLLGRLVEHVDGETWDACLQRRLVRPMGLDGTVTLPEDVLLRPYALGCTTDAGAGELKPLPRWGGNRASGPCGIISAAAGDVIAFARMHVADGVAPNGQRLLSAEACRAMRERQVRLTPHAGTEAWGLGFELSSPGGRLVFGHGGNTAGQTGALKMIPDRGGAVLLQTNSDAGRARCDDVLRSVLREWFGIELEEPLTAPADPPAVDLDRWVGVYERVDTRFEVRRAESGGLEVTITSLRPYGAVEPAPPRTLAMTPCAEGVFLIQPEGSPRPVPMVFREWEDAGAYLHLGLRSAPRS
ncbi:MAG TPA: serine hydrolase domain-containing protein [Candidatus Dormibacteraeota bacterium]